MATSTVGLGPRYAPHDPTLPVPWRALVDGSTGYIYYWNPETNVTQYERPVPQAPPLPAGPPPAASSSSATVPKSVSSTNGPSGATDAQITRLNDGQLDASDGNVQVNIKGISHGNIARSTKVVADGNPYRNTSANAYVNTAGPPHVAVRGSSDMKSHVNAPGNLHGTSVASAPAQPNLVTSVAADSHRSAVGGNAYGSITVPIQGTMHGRSGPKLQASSGRNVQGTGGSMHRPAGNVPRSSGVSVPGQPKLAVIPVLRRQNIGGGVHQTLNSTVVHAHANAAAPGPSGVSVPAYKRNANTYNSYGDQEQYKRSRVQGYSEPAPTMDVESYKRQHEVSAVGDNVPDPFMTFDATGFPVEILGELRMAGFTSPTPIQAQSWPIVLQNRDIVAIAKTGSGKTLGYLLPAFLHLRQHYNNSQLGPTVLVLSPTRELATQIQDEAVKFGRSSRITSTCVYGGAPKGPQLRDLERGADIVIATPGRLNDFLEVRKVSLRQVTYLVLDEADRMLDMGFEPQIRKIVNEMPLKRQTLMYTATWPKEVRKIAGDLLVSPVQVNIGNADELTANKSITQYVEMVQAYEKHRRLEQILRTQGPDSKVIIFCSTKKMCDQLARTIGRDFGAAVIHGDKSQTERDHVLAQFKSGRSPILVATDVAARGLDVKDIRVVINFDFPTGIEDYVHRIGRTGRAGATGIAYTFFSEQDAKYAKELVKVLEGASQKVPLELRDIAGRSLYVKGRGGRWDTGGRGGQDGGRTMFRGARGEALGGRGAWNAGGQFSDRRDKTYDRFGDQERYDRDGCHDRYPDDRNHGREAFRRFGDRGHSYSRSRSRSHGYSRSRSRSNDRYSDGYICRSPYHGSIPCHSRSPFRSPPYHGGSPHHGSPGDVARHVEAPPQNTSSCRGSSFQSSSPQRGASPRNRSPFRAGYAPYRRGSPVYRIRSPSKGSSPALNAPSRRCVSPLNSSSPWKGGTSPICSSSPCKDVSQYFGNDAPHKGILQNLNKSSSRVTSPSRIGPSSKAVLPHSGLPHHSLNVASQKGSSSFESTSPQKGGVPTIWCASSCKEVQLNPNDILQKGSSSFESTSPQKGGVPTIRCASSCKEVQLNPNDILQKGALMSFRRSSPPKGALIPQTGSSSNASSTPNTGLPCHATNVLSLKGATLCESTLPQKGGSSPARHFPPCIDVSPYPSDLPTQRAFLPSLNKPFAKGVPLSCTGFPVKDTSAHKVGSPPHISNMSSQQGAMPFQSPPQKGEVSPGQNGSPHKDSLLYESGVTHKGAFPSLNRSSSPTGVFLQIESSVNAGLGNSGLPYQNSNVLSQKGTLPIQSNSPPREVVAMQYGSPVNNVSRYAIDVSQKVVNESSTIGTQTGLCVKEASVHTSDLPFQAAKVPSLKVTSLQCISPRKRGTSPVTISSSHSDVILYPSDGSPVVAAKYRDLSPKSTSATQIGPSHVGLPSILNVSSQKEAVPGPSILAEKGETSPEQNVSLKKVSSPCSIDVFQKGGMANSNNSTPGSDSPETDTFI